MIYNVSTSGSKTASGKNRVAASPWGWRVCLVILCWLSPLTHHILANGVALPDDECGLRVAHTLIHALTDQEMSYAEIRRRHPVTDQGISLAELQGILNASGLQTLVVNTDFEHLQECLSGNPGVVHLRPGHFAIATRQSFEPSLLTVQLHDPPTFMKMGVDEFKDRWTGHLLLVSRNEVRPLDSNRTVRKLALFVLITISFVVGLIMWLCNHFRRPVKPRLSRSAKWTGQSTMGLTLLMCFAGLGCDRVIWQSRTPSAGPMMDAIDATLSVGELPLHSPLADRTKSIHLTNVGDETLRINWIRTGCGCIDAVPDTRSIPPGDSTELQIRIAAKQIGHHRFHVDVGSNCREKPVRRFPVSWWVVGEVVASPRHVHFGSVTHGETPTVSVAFKHERDLDWETIRTEFEPEFLSDRIDLVRQGGCLELTVRKDTKPNGSLVGRLKLIDAGDELLTEIPITGTVRDGISISPRVLTMNAGSTKHQTLVIENVDPGLGPLKAESEQLRIVRFETIRSDSDALFQHTTVVQLELEASEPCDASIVIRQGANEKIVPVLVGPATDSSE